MNLNLHPKVKAAAYAFAGVDLLAIGAYLQGSLTGKAAVGAILAGLAPVLASYAKGA